MKAATIEPGASDEKRIATCPARNAGGLQIDEEPQDLPASRASLDQPSSGGRLSAIEIDPWRWPGA